MNTIPARVTAITVMLACLLLAAGCEPSSRPAPTPSPALPPSSKPAVKRTVPFVASCPLASGQRLSPPPRATLDSGPIRPNLFDFESQWDHREGQGFRYKIPWLVAAEKLEVRVDRLDAPGTGEATATLAAGDVDPPPGQHFFAGGVFVPAAGCWRVTATIPDGTSLSFTFRTAETVGTRQNAHLPASSLACVVVDGSQRVHIERVDHRCVVVADLVVDVADAAVKVGVESTAVGQRRVVVLVVMVIAVVLVVEGGYSRHRHDGDAHL